MERNTSRGYMYLYAKRNNIYGITCEFFYSLRGHLFFGTVDEQLIVVYRAWIEQKITWVAMTGDSLRIYFSHFSQTYPVESRSCFCDK